MLIYLKVRQVVVLEVHPSPDEVEPALGQVLSREVRVAHVESEVGHVIRIRAQELDQAGLEHGLWKRLTMAQFKHRKLCQK